MHTNVATLYFVCLHPLESTKELCDPRLCCRLVQIEASLRFSDREQEFQVKALGVPVKIVTNKSCKNCC